MWRTQEPYVHDSQLFGWCSYCDKKRPIQYTAESAVHERKKHETIYFHVCLECYEAKKPNYKPQNATCIMCPKQAEKEFSTQTFFPAIRNSPIMEKFFCSKWCCQSFRDKFDIDTSALCRVCFMSATKKCARCKFARYCSEECQKKDWTKHKIVCTNFKLSLSKQT